MSEKLLALIEKWKDSAVSLNEAETLIARLIEVIEKHNKNCEYKCDFSNCGFDQTKQKCGYCPLDWKI